MPRAIGLNCGAYEVLSDNPMRAMKIQGDLICEDLLPSMAPDKEKGPDKCAGSCKCRLVSPCIPYDLLGRLLQGSGTCTGGQA